MRPRLLAIVLLMIVAGSHAEAQTTGKLSRLFAELYGPDGLIVESLAVLPSGATHSAHFNNNFQSDFAQFNIAFASQLAAVPIPSPASGFTYVFDAELGTFKRSSNSFGPIMTDRAVTVGRRKFAFGFSYQRFSFDSIEGVDLGDIPAVFTHDGAAPGGKADVVTTSNSVEATVDQFLAFFTFGLHERIDLSIAVPIVRSDLTVRSAATIRRIGTSSNPLVHFFGAAGGSQKAFKAAGTASGVGDVHLQLKGTLLKEGPSAMALGVDVRLPSGDEEELLGAGAPGVRPFLSLSSSFREVGGHVSVGYQWNGDSILGSGTGTDEKADLPDVFLFSAGADFRATDRLTVIFDVINQRFIDAPRLRRRTFMALDGETTFPDITFDDATFTQTSGAFGLKFNPVSSLLLDANILFKLDDDGLRDDITPLFGLEYSF